MSDPARNLVVRFKVIPPLVAACHGRRSRLLPMEVRILAIVVGPVCRPVPRDTSRSHHRIRFLARKLSGCTYLGRAEIREASRECGTSEHFIALAGNCFKGQLTVHNTKCIADAAKALFPPDVNNMYQHRYWERKQGPPNGQSCRPKWPKS